MTKTMGFIVCLSVLNWQSVGLDAVTNLQYQQDTVDVGGLIPQVTLWAHRWASVFADDPKCARLVQTVSTGIDVKFTPPKEVPDDVPNYVKDEFKHKVDQQFCTELSLGRVVLRPDWFPTWGLSAVGCVDKDHSNFEKIRIINDLARPLGSSVNDCTEVDKYRFASVADAYSYMTPFAFMSKVDYSGAYRAIGFCARLWRYHVWEWRGTIMMDLRLMFGHSSGPGEFTELSQAIVRKVKGMGCPGTIGYLDDIINIASTYEEAYRCHLIVVELSSFLGFELNPSKVEAPVQDIIYLGIRLQTNADGAGAVVSSIAQDKIDTLSMLCKRVCEQEFLKKSDLEWLVGLMSFCSQVILGSRLFMRHAYALLKHMKHRRVRRAGVPRLLREDLLFWPKLVAENNGKAVSVVRRVLHTDFFAVDASLLIGMGGYLLGDYFAVTWAEVRAWAPTGFEPFRDVASGHINYLEIYVIWYALHVWGERLRGMEVLIWTDNTTAEANVRDLWGKAPFLPVLKAIWLLCVKYDVRLRTLPIRSKVNVESDSLSRQDWVTFAESVGMGKAKAAALARRDPVAMQELEKLCSLQARAVKDFDDWMVVEPVFRKLWVGYGPFNRDGAVDVHKSNTWCRDGWSLVEDATRQDWDEENIYCNPPYSCILDFLIRFLFCKLRSPFGTAALFVLPLWEGTLFWDLIQQYPEVFKIVETFGTGSDLFTSPNQRGWVRKHCGPTKWPVVVVRVGAEPLTVPVSLDEWVPIGKEYLVQ